MEVRPGYKWTDVGVIPEQWNVETVGEAFEIRNHLRLPISQAVRERMSGSYPYYGPTAVQGWINEHRVEGEHALIGEDGDHFLKWREQTMTLLVTGKFNVNNHAHIVRGTKNLTAWFYWFFAHRDISRYLTRQGAGRYKLTKAALLTLPCAIPLASEQRAIAAALSDIDALLDGLDRLIAKKRDLKQAAMQQLLTGQTRLPGFSGEWEVKRLGECLLSRPEYGINAPAVSYSDRLPTYIRITDITESGRFRPAPRVSVQSTFADRYLLNDGDVVFARTGASVGKSYQYRPEDGPLVFAGFLIRIRPDRNTLLSAYLSAYVLTNSYWSWVRLMSMRSGQPGINGNEYAQLLIRLPPIEEQTAIAVVLSDMDAEIAALEARRDKTRALKQGMMQELLTGRIRLVDPSIPKLSEGEPDASTATGH